MLSIPVLYGTMIWGGYVLMTENIGSEAEFWNVVDTSYNFLP